MASVTAQLAPTGTLRVGVWTVPYFAQERDGALHGIIPDLGSELARRAGVPVQFVPFANPATMVEAFRASALDVTFVGVTAERAEAIDFGPVLFEIQTTYLVPASSTIASIAEIDRPGVRIAVPSPSAQQAHLNRIIQQATLLPVAPENPQAALDLIAVGKADAFSHVAPMLAEVQQALPGSRILSGSYFNVPIAVGVAKGRATTVVDAVQAFAEDMKRSGFLQQCLARTGTKGLAASG